MKIILVIVLVCLSAAYGAKLQKRTFSIDQGSHVDECDQEPMELGIVLDSSRSINVDNFEKTRKFLRDFLDHFFIGDGHDDVRVSLITFGEGIYPENGFNLTTFRSKGQVLDAVMTVPHSFGKRTDTYLAINYMHAVQMTPAQVRSWAEKICVVITDGNSQRGDLTAKEAKFARDKNITMYSVGIGNVAPKELINIAGDPSRVTQVKNFDQLDSVKSILAKKTCIRKEKPTTTTTTPMPQTGCGELYPTDVNFVFSPADMGLDDTSWTTSFISKVLDGEDMDNGFRYGVMSASCPDDEGFPLDEYTNPLTMNDQIKEHLSRYDKVQLPKLISRAASRGFTEANGGRPDTGARKVAVLFAGAGGKKKGGLQRQVDELLAQGVEVFIASPSGSNVRIPGAQELFGGSNREQAEAFLSLLCEY